jgi:hypothetical protein
MLTSPTWIADALDRLGAAPCGYHTGEVPASEPTALAALARIGAGGHAESQLQWLAKCQTTDGSVPPLADLNQPGWPTPLAIIATVAADRANIEQSAHFSNLRISDARNYLLSLSGKTLDPSTQYGHNGQLVGWPWVTGTHSWQEPTAFAVLALKSIGLWDHPRTREGVQLLIDRLLDTGGCNYGNTVVLGQRLRPHVEPTGAALLALAGENWTDPRIERSINWLTGAINAETTPVSLSYGLLGLTAHDRVPKDTANWLESASRRTIRRGAAPLNIALLILAAQGNDCPLIALAKRTSGAPSA